MFLCVMKTEYEVSPAVPEILAVEPNEAADTEGNPFVPSKPAVIGVVVNKCYVEMNAAMVVEKLESSDNIWDFYEIQIDENSVPYLSKITITGTTPKMVETSVMQNAQGNEIS